MLIDREHKPRPFYNLFITISKVGHDLDADWSRENPLPGHDLEKVTALNADWSREDLLPGHDLEKVTVPRP